jgi:2-keto-4-pentenoate hydratase/2-oxohepta-3-ene-1,7-dioic acid hydratase in catechol pathway
VEGRPSSSADLCLGCAGLAGRQHRACGKPTISLPARWLRLRAWSAVPRHSRDRAAPKYQAPATAWPLTPATAALRHPTTRPLRLLKEPSRARDLNKSGQFNGQVLVKVLTRLPCLRVVFLHPALCILHDALSLMIGELTTVRLARFRADHKDRVGFIDGESLVEVSVGWAEVLARVVEDRAGLASLGGGARWPIDECELLIPIDEATRGIYAIGFNYREHADEIGDELGDTRTGRPPIFFKIRPSLLAAGRALVLDPEFSKEMDWEVELGVVIGRPGRKIPVNKVGRHVAGYTVVVDTTARDRQREHGQWFIGKNAAASSPIGPWVTTVDELGFPPVVELSLSGNGVEKQRAASDNMIWRIEEFIAMTSQGIELQAGDVFATGSPPGVGFTRRPPEFLTRGDVLRAEISQVGWLEHAVR